VREVRHRGGWQEGKGPKGQVRGTHRQGGETRNSEEEKKEGKKNSTEMHQCGKEGATDSTERETRLAGRDSAGGERNFPGIENKASNSSASGKSSREVHTGGMEEHFLFLERKNESRGLIKNWVRDSQGKLEWVQQIGAQQTLARGGAVGSNEGDRTKNGLMLKKPGH